MPGPQPPPIGSPDRDVAALVAAARSGDDVAFASLYGRFAERVYRFCLLRVRSAADAEDLTQVIFIRVVENLARFEERGVPFAAWLFRIARNASIDFERARRPDAEVFDDADGMTGPNPLEAIEERQELLGAIGGLARAQREVLWYRFFADRSTTEIAALMQREESAVRSLQARAVASLRRRLTDETVSAAPSDSLVWRWTEPPEVIADRPGAG